MVLTTMLFGKAHDDDDDSVKYARQRLFLFYIQCKRGETNKPWQFLLNSYTIQDSITKMKITWSRIQIDVPFVVESFVFKVSGCKRQLQIWNTTNSILAIAFCLALFSDWCLFF